LVYELKAAMPDFPIIVNGGITSLEEADAHLAYVDGVMLGRAAYQSPAILASVDSRLFGGADGAPDLRTVVMRYAGYAASEVGQGVPLPLMIGPLLGLFQSVPGARAFRRHLTLEARRPGADAGVILEALALIGRREAVPA
jgi:tRNA-dihydrouridine synthase A